jgi:hypothetical protein
MDRMMSLIATQTGEVRTSPKKARKPQQRSLALRQAIVEVARDYDRFSVRQLFYQLVARGVIEKTENAYKRVCDAAVQMRLTGSLDYRKVTDGHRERRIILAHSGLHGALQSAHEFYRRDYWREQPDHVEVWCEKDALSGVIQPIANRYGVPYVATRGFPSLTLLYESAQAIRATGKPATIFYFGDHDASGQSISACVARLRQFGAEVAVARVALNPDQVVAYRLPTRPGKRTDSRHAGFVARFGDAAVELDALPPDVLTELVEESILSMIAKERWYAVMEQERLERETLASLATAAWTPGHRYAAPTEVA